MAYSPSGVPLWTNRFDEPGGGIATAVAVDANGDVIVTGYSSTGFFSDFVTIHESLRGGRRGVTNRYKGLVGYDDQANALATDSNGNVFVTGTSGRNSANQDYATVAYSSAGVPLWTNRYDGPGQSWDSASAVGVDASGNVFVTGTVTVSGVHSDFATIKYSNAGVPLWTNLYSGPGYGQNRSSALAIDDSGTVVVTGWSDGGGGNYQYATVAYSNAGVEMWVNLYGGAGPDTYSVAIAAGAGGNMYVTGYSGSTYSHDYATVAYSAQGEPLWTNLYSGTGNADDQAFALAVDGSGNVFVTGTSKGVGDPDDYDCATIKYSSVGVPLWTNRYNGPAHGSDLAKAIVVANSGNVYVTGSSGSGWNPGYATVAYSAAGAPLWTNRYYGPGNRHDEPAAIAVDGNGNVSVTGRSWTAAGADYATIKYTSGGAPLWTNRYNGVGTGNDGAVALAVDSNGNVFVTGFSDGTTSGPDYVTIKYSG